MNADAALRLIRERCNRTLCLVDVGARWGASGRWTRLGRAANILCFEPDAEECARLSASSPANVKYLPFALADTNGVRDLHVTSEAACSSLHSPIPALYEHYPPLAITKPLRTVPVYCRRLDDVLLEHGISDVAAIKLDTQGSELAILGGARKALEQCSLIDIEVEFNPIYVGQGLFCDVDRFLRDHGFVLWRFENLVHYAPATVANAASEILLAAEPAPSVTASVANGQIFWAQAHYVRASYPRTGVDRMSVEEACPAAILAGLYGMWDLCLELIRKTGDDTLHRNVSASLSG